MKIIPISQTHDRDNWKEFRRGKITGTSIGKLYAKSRSKDGGFTDRPLQTFWIKVAERLSIDSGEESPMVRGTRLEDEAVNLACEKLGLTKFVDDALTWQSDDNVEWLCSPDAYEDSENPKWAMECKCLNTDNHLRMIFNDQIDEEYYPQITNYFLVNENLEKLYFVLYDPRVAIDGLVLKIFTVVREDISDWIEMLKNVRGKGEAQIMDTVRQLLEMGEQDG